ncbi:MAG: hypothetical protein SFU56_03980, partial [Capsulimonadales bacterium]|nr:hypothetical protein [Capsulimonadales bacterium]
MPFPFPPIGGEVAPAAIISVYQQQPPDTPAASSTAPSLTVDDAVRVAVANNRRLAAAVRDVSAARQGVRAAGNLTNPTALFNPALTGGVQGGSDTEVLFQQPLEVNGTRTARRGVASAQMRRADALAVAELRSVVFTV